jgi:site-specific DNA recombinase
MRTAAYARYSSDSQREASLEDQLRNCRAYCARMGWPDPVVFQDAAISGARADRPGYKALQDRATEFDVIVVDDLSRLSRDSVECQRAVRRLTFSGVRLVGVSDGVDTGRKSHKADVGLRGLMSELYLDDLAEKTHRGLTGRALAGANAGGKAYGYTIPRVGELAIDEAQAAVVRRIFAEYIAGATARKIAAGLNRDGVPSARGSTWALSAIYGDQKRGIGILANTLYVGRQVWNRSRWVKHPETGRRVRQNRPEAEWITTEHPELAIVDVATWEAAQARHGACAVPTRGEHRTRHAGRPPKHLLSGILRCEECGGPLVVVDGYKYGCARAKDRGTCSNRLRVSRVLAERTLLRSIREDFLSEPAFRRYQRTFAATLKRQAPDADSAKSRLAAAEKELANVTAAIKAGIITPSTRQMLVDAEAAVRAAHDELRALDRATPAVMLPRMRERWHRIVGALEDHSRRTDMQAARMAVEEVLGDRVVVRRNENGDLVAEIAASSASQITVVAGAGFEPATFGL